MRYERPHVGIFLDDFVGGLARAMTGTGFDADQLRPRARFGCLQSGGIFEAVPGYDAIIGISGGDEDRWISDSRPNIVAGRRRRGPDAG